MFAGAKMMAIALAALAAIGWGASDFLGGAAQDRHTPVLSVVAASELIGVIVLIPVVAARGLPPADPRLLLAALAGLGVALELSLIYAALAAGAAFITAPVGALGTALAVGAGLIGGDPLTVAIAVGLVLAIGGGALSAGAGDADGAGRLGPGRSAVVCIGAAAAIATGLIALHGAGQVDPYWAVAVEHTTTAVCAGAIALVVVRRRDRGTLRLVPTRDRWGALTAIALTGTGGDVAYTAASGRGALSLVSTIASLYPVATVALGVAVSRRRTGLAQALGIVIALSGAALLGAASP
jgi:drug/metabolite transporter (DMT)-like permease